MARYKELVPHIAFYALFFGLLGFAFLVNSGTLAKYYASVAAVLTDPLIWAVGILCGVIIYRFLYLIPTLFLSALVASYIISEMNAEWLGYKKFTIELILIRFVALVFIALLINGGIVMFNKNKARVKGSS